MRASSEASATGAAKDTLQRARTEVRSVNFIVREKVEELKTIYCDVMGAMEDEDRIRWEIQRYLF